MYKYVTETAATINTVATAKILQVYRREEETLTTITIVSNIKDSTDTRVAEENLDQKLV